MEASSTPTPEDGQAAPPVCYRHPGRETHVRCTRCDRYICPDCMRSAAVGFQCPECVNEGNREVRHAQTAFGATIRQNFVPWVTYTLIALNVLVYIAEIAGGDEFVYRFADWGGVREYAGGFQIVDPSDGIVNGEWYRMITGAFLHAQPGEGISVLHILFNMYMLWMLGRVVEQGLGHLRFVVLYVVAALGGSVVPYIVSPEVFTYGASGAIFGLIGAYYLMTRRVGRPDTQFLVTGLVWLVISAGFASWEGHLGGLLAGSAVAYAYAYTPQQHRKVLHIAGPALVLVAIVVATMAKTAALTP
ncbi:rhomboid family intramembrane serine protease [Streptomyces sp. NPDC051940]|uniref:rhomboid family intramembrane serine protease n=1 Tax=Streptomyces sp. NPDC051940 TaxID=3155675 RepID=UPI00342B3B3A